jgi:hypothetical protein
MYVWTTSLAPTAVTDLSVTGITEPFLEWHHDSRLGFDSMASESNVVENLAYLSKYLEESNARVSELETELANVVSHFTFLDSSNPIKAA